MERSACWGLSLPLHSLTEPVTTTIAGSQVKLHCLKENRRLVGKAPMVSGSVFQGFNLKLRGLQQQHRNSKEHSDRGSWQVGLDKAQIRGTKAEPSKSSTAASVLMKVPNRSTLQLSFVSFIGFQNPPESTVEFPSSISVPSQRQI